MKALPLMLAVLCSACAANPLTPSPATQSAAAARVQWALSGQSNAVGLKPPLSALEPVVGVQQNSTPIAAWNPDQPLWQALAASLPGSTAFIWWQGEADFANPDAYRGAVEDLINRVVSLTGPIPVVICGANAKPDYAGLRAVQEAVALAHGWRFIRSDDLPQPQAGDLDIPTQTILPPMPSNASPHLTAEGYQTMAQRIATALH